MLTALLAGCLTVTLLWVFSAGRASAAGAVSITRTFQPAETTGVDTYVSQIAPTTNFATNASVIVSGHSKAGEADIRRSILQFNDIANIPNGSTVSSATLSVYDAIPGTGTRTVNAHYITSNWVESTATYNSPPTFNATATSSTTNPAPASPAFMNWTVTTDVSAFVGQTLTNYGWLLKDNAETHTGQITTCTNTFDSASGATATNRPKLAVTFQAVWDSYNDSGRTAQDDDFSSGENTVYMKGTGYNLGGSYVIGYYDASGDKQCAESVAAASGTLNSSCTFWTGAAGSWNAVTFEPGVSAPATYASISSDTHKVIGNDTLTVQAAAILPELPSVVASIVVGLSTVAVYHWFHSKSQKLRGGMAHD
ncbi:MAG: uncharacterized protein HW403_26 [Dehalococcoidia bacterium]|nr:uncharacterized protein [Dehalococcoidia bacterium]